MESRATLEAGKPVGTSRAVRSELKEGGQEGDPGENETCPLGIRKERRVSLSLQLARLGKRGWALHQEKKHGGGSWGVDRGH